MNISDGQLTSLDLSKNRMLVQLKTNNNSLNELDVSKNVNLTYLDVRNNPLTCIQVNQDQLGDIPTDWYKDSGATYSLDCEY